jgi:hypothetical protein
VLAPAAYPTKITSRTCESRYVDDSNKKAFALVRRVRARVLLVEQQSGMADKVRFFLLKADEKNLSAERLAKLYEKLTGKKLTEEEVEAARRKLARNDHR